MREAICTSLSRSLSLYRDVPFFPPWLSLLPSLFTSMINKNRETARARDFTGCTSRSPEQLHTTSVDLMDAADNWKLPLSYLCIFTRWVDKRWRGRNIRREDSVCRFDFASDLCRVVCVPVVDLSREKLKRCNFCVLAYAFHILENNRWYLCSSRYDVRAIT
jgi:hypothetical protein